MLHSTKCQAILEWYNCLTTKGDVDSFAQFTDGSHFYEIVASLQPVNTDGNNESNLSETVIFSETTIARNEVVITSVEEEEAEEEIEPSFSGNGNADLFVIRDSDHIEMQKRYDAIRKFIDDFYLVESSSLIDYGECQNGEELELAKVAVFLLAAVVANLLSSKDNVVYNTTLLEPEVQENIRECLSFVLVEKCMKEKHIKRSELHKILSHPASFEGTLLRNQPSQSDSDPNELSEGGRNVPKSQKEETSSIIYENAQESPLKKILQTSEIQYRAGVFKMATEVARLRVVLASKKDKTKELLLSRKNFNEKLKEKDNELEFYKKQIEEVKKKMYKTEESRVEMNSRFEKVFESHQEKIKQLKEEKKTLQKKNIENELKKTAEKASLIENFATLKKEKQILELNNVKAKETFQSLNEKISHLKEDLKNYQLMNHASLPPDSRRELTESPLMPETLNIISADKEQKRKEHSLIQNPSTIKLQLQYESLKKENSIMKENLKYLEEKFGPVIHDSAEKKNDKICAVTELLTIIELIGEKDIIAPALLMNLRKNCNTIKGYTEFEACLKELEHALRQSVIPPITKGHAAATKEAQKMFLTRRNRKLEKELEVMKTCAKEATIKEDELKESINRMELLTSKVKQENVEKTIEIENLDKKCHSLKMLIKKKDKVVKKKPIMYRKNMKYLRSIYPKLESEVPSVKRFEKLQRKFKELQKDCIESENELTHLKILMKVYQDQIAQQLHTVKVFTEQSERLKFEVWLKKSGFEGERDAKTYLKYLEYLKQKAPEKTKEPKYSGNDHKIPETKCSEDDSEDSDDSTSYQSKPAPVSMQCRQESKQAFCNTPYQPVPTTRWKFPLKRPATLIRRQYATPVIVQRLMSMKRKRKVPKIP